MQTLQAKDEAFKDSRRSKLNEKNDRDLRWGCSGYEIMKTESENINYRI